MINKLHIQKFHDMQTYMPSQKDIKNLKSDILYFIPVIQAIAKYYNIKNVDDMKNAVPYFANTLLDKYSQVGYIDSTLYEHQAIEYLLRNPWFIEKEYPKLKDLPNDHIVYTSNLSRSKRLALINAICDVNICENFAAEKHITAKTTFNMSAVSDDKRTDTKYFFKFLSKILKASTPCDKIQIVLLEELEKNEEYSKTHLIESISAFYSFFNDLGFIDKYLASYEYNSKKFGFPELAYEKTTGNFTKKGIGFQESFSKEFLETLDITSLCFLNAFWSNRFAKECEKFNIAACAINSLDLWENILNNHNFEISDVSLISALRKFNYISPLLQESFMLCQNSVINQEIQEGKKFSGSLNKDITPYYIQLNNYIGKDYSLFFGEHLSGENNFLNDVIFATQLSNLQMYAYQKKNTTIEPLIKYALDNPHFIKNWGIIRNEINDGVFVDSVDSKKAKILMAFDIEGFNFPFRFHLYKSSIENLLKNNNGKKLIPEYQGNEDFIVDNEVIPSNIIMPLQQKFKNTIITTSTDPSKNINLWEHFYFLMNGTYPKHLSQTVKKKNKQIIYVRLPICYTDITTGKRYQEINKTLQEIDDNDGR